MGLPSSSNSARPSFVTSVVILRVRAFLNQKPDDRRAVPASRKHERGLAMRFFRIDRRAMIQQRTHGCDATGSCGRHQRSGAVGERHVGVPTGLEQSLDEFGIAGHTRKRQRRHAIHARGPVRVRARFQELPHGRKIVARCGVVKRRLRVQCGCERAGKQALPDHIAISPVLSPMLVTSSTPSLCSSVSSTLAMGVPARRGNACCL